MRYLDKVQSHFRNYSTDLYNIFGSVNTNTHTHTHSCRASLIWFASVQYNPTLCEARIELYRLFQRRLIAQQIGKR